MIPIKLIQVREDEFINVAAIASVRLFTNDIHKTEHLPYNQQRTRKVGETFSIRIQLIGVEKEIHVIEPLAGDVYDVLFPAEETT